MLDQRALFRSATTLFDLDERGRMRGRGSHLHVFRTPHDVVCFCHESLADDVAASLEAIALRPRGRPRDWSAEYAEYVRALMTVGVPRAVRAGPVYSFPNALPDGDAALSISENNAYLLRGGLEEWLPDVTASRPMSAMIVDGHAVALCASVAMSSDAHSAGVETLADYRQRGLAAQAVAAWARSVQALGATPIYATTFDNTPSQNVARRLGLRPFGSEFSVELQIG